MVLIFCRLWTKVHQVKQTCRGVFADCNTCFPIIDTLFQSGYIRDQVATKNRAKIVGPPIFYGEGDPKFFTQFYKLQLPSNM